MRCCSWHMRCNWVGDAKLSLLFSSSFLRYVMDGFVKRGLDRFVSWVVPSPSKWTYHHHHVQRRTPARAVGGRSFELNRRGTRRKTPFGDSHVVQPQVRWNHECGQEQVRMAQTNGSLAGSGQHQRCGCMGRGSNSRCRPCKPKQGRREEKQSARLPQHSQTRVNASKAIPIGTAACKQS